MSKKIKNIFSDTTCPTEEMMLKYTSNLLEAGEKHDFERHLSGCAFCSEALEGLTLMNNKEVKEDVLFLKRKIDGISNPGRRVGYWPWAVAASVSILLLTGTWFYLQSDLQSPLAVEVETNAPKEEILENESISEVPEVFVKDSIINKNRVSGNYRNQKNIALNKTQSVEHTWSATPEHMEERELSKRHLSDKQEEFKEGEYTNDEKIHAGYVSGEMMSSAPVSTTRLMTEGKKDTTVFLAKTKYPALNEMLAMVESEFQQGSSGNVSEKKKTPRKSNSISEAGKDRSFDDCPNCPKKVASEKAESNLVVISMDYALKKYQMKEYEMAHKQFEEIIKQDKNFTQTNNAKIFDALSLLNLNRIDEAFKIVDPMATAPTTNTNNAAKWIKASILIDRKENFKAKVILENLANYNNYYQDKSKEILKTLR